MKTGGSDVRSARVNACSIDIGDDKQRVNTACDITMDADDDETTLMKVQVNRCVVEVPSATDDTGSCAYAFECPTTLRVGESEVTLKHTPASSASCDSDVISGETKPDRVLMARPSTLTYVSLLFEGKGPYKCLVDSGSEMPIAKRAVISDLNKNLQSVGQVRLQGIFGDSVLADLMTLQVKVPCCDADPTYDELPIVFAITDEIVQDCDFIIPADVVQLMNAGHSSELPSSLSCNVVTRSRLRH